MQVDSYQPPPPPKVITEQPKPGGTTQHFHPFERTYPKTLESLAERVHPFYGLQGPGAMGLSLLSGPGGQGGPGAGPGHSATLGRASTLGRIRGAANQPMAPGNTMSLMRAGRGLQRSGSDQRLPMMEGGTDFYEYMMSGLSSSKTSLKSAGVSPGLTYSGQSANRQTAGASVDAATRLGVTRRRTSIDYASDTEASTRSYGASRQRTGRVPGYVERSWKTPALIGLGTTPTTPTTPTAAFAAQQQQASSRF
jgi:Rho GTPase-activating protein SYDE